MAIRRANTIGLLLAAGILLTGCTGEAQDSEQTAMPTADASNGSAEATPTPDPTAAAEAAAAADEALLPMPVDEISEWAKTAVPDTAGAGWAMSGWISEHSSPRQRSTMQSLDPGAYQAQIACRGDGTITATVGEVDGAGEASTVTCTNGTIAFDVTTTRPGMQALLEIDGAPSIYAVSFTPAG